MKLPRGHKAQQARMTTLASSAMSSAMPCASSLSMAVSRAAPEAGAAAPGCLSGGLGLLLLLAAPDPGSGFGELLTVGFFLRLPLPRGSKLPAFPAAVLFFLRSGRALKGFDDGPPSSGADDPPGTAAELEDAAISCWAGAASIVASAFSAADCSLSAGMSKSARASSSTVSAMVDKTHCALDTTDGVTYVVSNEHMRSDLGSSNSTEPYSYSAHEGKIFCRYLFDGALTFCHTSLSRRMHAYCNARWPNKLITGFRAF